MPKYTKMSPDHPGMTLYKKFNRAEKELVCGGTKTFNVRNGNSKMGLSSIVQQIVALFVKFALL